MARTEIKLNKISQFNSPMRLEAPTFESIGMAAEVKVNQQECDKMVLLFRLTGATSAGSVFIRAGDGIQAVNDLEVSIPSSEDNEDGLGTVVAVCIESGRFKIMNGADKGKIFIDGNPDVGVLAIELP
jgi:hypothetical protein